MIDFMKLNIPAGIRFFYALDVRLRPIRRDYLMRET